MFHYSEPGRESKRNLEIAVRIGYPKRPKWTGKRGPASGWHVQPDYTVGAAPAIRGRREVVMRTQGEIEAAVCDGITRFEQDHMGRGPKSIHAHLVEDLLVVRLQGVLTAAEQQLVKSQPAEKGRDLLKQVRTHLLETARPLMEAMIQDITGVNVLSLHHDISTVTGEELVVFTLAAAPYFRETKRQ
jgi:uncharacterized protein YbcI